VAAPPTTAAATPTTTGGALFLPCDANALFAAAVKKEGFDPHDPSYPQMGPGQEATATFPVCVMDWALATISRPNVGTTDGETLFHAVGAEWVEVVDVGAPVTPCTLQQNQGVPLAVAKALLAKLGANTTC